MKIAMGGEKGYQEFQKYCCLAFSILRNHENVHLILNLLHLMRDSNLPGFSKQVQEKIITNFIEKYQLQLNDEEADQYLINLLQEGLNSLYFQIIDKVHDMATRLK